MKITISRAIVADKNTVVESKKSTALPYLSLTALLLLAVLLYLVPQDLALMDSIERLKTQYIRLPRERERMKRLLANDPIVGSSLVANQNGMIGKVLASAELKGKESTVLLFIGPCASCIATDLRTWIAVAQDHPRIGLAVISRDTLANIEKFRRTENITIPFFRDTDGTTAKAVNALWVPRAYQIDRTGKLLWAQKDQGLSPDSAMQFIEKSPQMATMR